MVKYRDAVGVGVAFLLLCAVFTHSHPNSWNDYSRLATVEALVHQGTWAVENTIFGERTADRIFWNGHFYSDKPPLLSFLAAGVYAVLHRGFRISFDFTGQCNPTSTPYFCFALFQPRSADWAYYWLTLLLVGLPSAAMLSFFYRSALLLGLARRPAILVTGTLGLGTLILPYSLVFNNHLPTAASLMVGFYALARAQTGGKRWLAWAGFASALAVTFDLLVAPFLACFFCLALIRYRRRAWPFVLGGALPLIATAALDWWMLGDPLPPSMHPTGFAYPGSLFPATLTGNTPPADVLKHGLQMMFGERGFFSSNPALLWALPGLWHLLRPRHALRGELFAVALATLITILSLILFTPGFGGVCYGVRWLADITPLFFLFAAAPALYHSAVQKGIFISLLAVSVPLAWHGALSPWSEALPPLRLAAYTVSPVGRYLESLPADKLAYTTLSERGDLPIFPHRAWRTSLQRFDPRPGLLPAGDPARSTIYVLSAGDQANRERLETTFPQGRWTVNTTDLAVYHVPSGDRPRPRLPAQAVFDRRIRLLGCDPPEAILRPGDHVSVDIYWQVESPMWKRYTAFVHLLGPTNPSTGNALWAQDDHQPGGDLHPIERWQPAEIVRDRFQFTLPADAPAGEYTLSTGFYDPVTYQRLSRSDAPGDTADLGTIAITQ